jgi:hypothetical protein
LLLQLQDACIKKRDAYGQDQVTEVIPVEPPEQVDFKKKDRRRWYHDQHADKKIAEVA